MPVRSKDTNELRQCLLEVGHVRQRDRADDKIDGVVGERHVEQVRHVELALGHLLSGERKHLGGAVNADHAVAERRQVHGVASGAAGGVQSHPHGEARQDLAHDGLFDLEELVPRLVVGRRPAGVAFTRRDGARRHPVAQLLCRVEERLDLVQPREGEVLVVGAGERPKERHAFEAEEIRQRVLVDDGSFDAGILVDLAGDAVKLVDASRAETENPPFPTWMEVECPGT